jgi:uncharacterized protein YkwD
MIYCLMDNKHLGKNLQFWRINMGNMGLVGFVKKKGLFLVFGIGVLLFSCETLNEGFLSLSNSVTSAVSSINSSSTPDSNADISSNEPESQQIAEIKAKWQQYKPKMVTKIFIETPSVIKPYRAGTLTPEFLTNGLNAFKFARYLAGLSENIIMTEELNDLGQHGAVVLAKIGHLTHTPSKPGDMDQVFYKRGYESTSTANIHWSSAGHGSLQEAVKGFCDDSDESNIDRLGHRRWMLNPKLGKTGFGYATSGAGSFVPIQVFDQSNTEKIDMDYVLWPNKGYFPGSFFGTAQAWSVSLNPDSYNLSRCKPTVKLICVSNRKEWVFTASDKNKKGKYFNIEKTNFGFPYCIIFRPDGITSFLFNKKFKVEIGGLVDKSGKTQQLEYEVEFFTLL